MNCKHCDQPMKEYLGFNMASSGKYDCVNESCAPKSMVAGASPPTIYQATGAVGIDNTVGRAIPYRVGFDTSSALITGTGILASGLWDYHDTSCGRRIYFTLTATKLPDTRLQEAIDYAKGRGFDYFKVATSPATGSMQVYGHDDPASLDPGEPTGWGLLIVIP